jgi:hypothetical protein
MQTLWTTLEQQAQARNIDLIVNGTVDGQVSRLSYDPSSDRYESDVPSSVSLSRAQVQMLIAEGDTLTVMGVPPPEGINQARDAGDLAATEAEEERAASRGH